MSAAPTGSYAGDVTPADTWAALSSVPGAVLVDVRTQAEWTFVGLPDLSSVGKRAACVEWQMYPEMTGNPSFVAQLSAVAPDRSAPVYFLCRSGARSRAAAIAATREGYAKAFNVAGGFEGDLDAEGRRGRASGWKAAGLPWRQS